MDNTVFKQGENEYTLKPLWLDVKQYYGILISKLAKLQTAQLGDVDIDLCEKYEADLLKFDTNIEQIEEALEGIPDDKKEEYKTKRNYDSLISNREACLDEYNSNRQAQREKKLRDGLYNLALQELIEDEKTIMKILPNILEGNIKDLKYDFVFAVEVLTAFFQLAGRNSQSLKNIKGNTTDI